MNGDEAQLTLARAGLNPNAAIAASAAADAAPVALEAPGGIPSIAPRRVRGLTMAVTVDSPPRHRCWRFFLWYILIKLAARVYPFKLELYRTRQPWEE